MAQRARCAVIGAANIDIGGFPHGRIAMQDSNPGRVRLSAGGVGRNIACNLARLGVETQLVAALGTDAFADIVREDCARAGVGTDLCFTFPGEGSSSYLFIADANGDMQLAVNDMGICDHMTPAALAGRMDALNAMDLVVVDANLPAETLGFLARQLRPPLLADAVSTAKAPRLMGALERLNALKPNAIEAEALTGIPVFDDASAARAARRLIDLGVGRVFITLGEKGACCADGRRTLAMAGAPTRMVNATGAGDAFTAALAWAQLGRLSLDECCAAGLAAASIALESMDTVSPDMSRAALLQRMAAIKAS